MSKVWTTRTVEVPAHPFAATAEDSKKRKLDSAAASEDCNTSAGLCNLKNTCFINALVQAIMSSASFTSCLGDPSTMAVNKSALTYLQLRRPSLWRHLSAITWLVLKWLQPQEHNHGHDVVCLCTSKPCGSAVAV